MDASAKMSGKQPYKSSSVRVISFFLAFVAVCVYTPILIDDLIKDNRSAQQRILRGEDPTQVLEETAAGTPSIIGECNTTDYKYARSSDGYVFILKADASLYAVDVAGVVRYYTVGKGGVVRPKLKTHSIPNDAGRDLKSMLDNCKSSVAVPVPDHISFGIDR
ncbi:MAG: hypothetical protein GY799_24835 [Desulfobulbaceae bacterium]|nr:hypothetical protein [Desulfobulbaceae bacterium]